MSSPREDMKKYITMKCIYAALQDGWSVKLKQPETRKQVYVFTKEHQGDTRQFECDEFIENFVEKYIYSNAWNG